MAECCGLFGKLPNKRDFISYNMPRPFLTTWEDWLQAGVAASRARLADQWQDFFLKAPIWRYWLGNEICGTTITGAVMPSVDQVGRYFPLSLCVSAPAGSRIDPPPVAAHEHWHRANEDLLLRILDDGFALEPPQFLEAFEPPPFAVNTAIEPPAGSHMVWRADLDATLQGLLTRDQQTTYAARTYWWTRGGESYPPQVFVCNGMPQAQDFSAFLTGHFEQGSAQ